MISLTLIIIAELQLLVLLKATHLTTSYLQVLLTDSLRQQEQKRTSVI